MRKRIPLVAAGAAVILTCAGFLLWTLGTWGGANATLWFDDLGEMVAPLIAAVVCGVAAWRHRGRGRVAWGLMSMSTLSWAVGEAVWSWYELWRNDAVPFPSFADAGYLASVPLALAAAMIFPGASRRGINRVGAAIDGLIIAAALLSISWVLVLRTVYEAGGDTAFAQALSLAYPISDVAIASMVLTLALRSTTGTRGRYLVLFAGLLCYAVADSMFAYLTANGTYGSGNPLDTAWVGGFLLVGLAAFSAALRPDRAAVREPVPSRMRMVLPYLPMVVATVMAVDQELSGHALGVFLFVTLITMVGLVVTRQFLTLLDNMHLVRRLGSRERQLEYQAFHDGLTGLANRVLFRRQVDDALDGDRGEGQVGVMFIDLDDFKNVNDTLGHDAGDRLLQVLAERLQASLRSTDLAARLGGDEFAVLLRGIRRVDAVVDVAERILAELRAPADIGGTVVRVHGTLGIALVEPGLATSDEVLRRADIAMYMGKRRGKGLFGLYEDSYNEAIVRTVEGLADLEKAVRDHEFSLLYQPIVEVATGRAVAVEALLRWDHPTRGRLLPVDFMAELESSDLIQELGGWILEEACAHAAGWRTAAARDLGIHVNVSARQLLEARLLDRVRGALSASGLPAPALTLDVTETSVSADQQIATGILRSLRRIGVKVSLDDFGTGYSSLGHLRTFPVDVIKIDRSFSADVGTSSAGGALAEALIRLGAVLGITTVAEGVEEWSQHKALRTLGCDLAQGYLYAHPLSAADMPAWLLDHDAATADKPRTADAGSHPGTAMRPSRAPG